MRTGTNLPPTPSGAFWQRFRALDTFRRSSEHRAVGGVAEGLSRHFDIDPIIVRVLFVALTFFGGAGIILYLALWLTVPSDNSVHSIISGRVRRDPQAWVTVGLGIGGVLAAAALLGSVSWAVPHPFPFLVIAMLLALGLVAFTRRRENRWSPPSGGTIPPPPPAPTPAATPPPPPPPASSASTWFPAEPVTTDLVFTAPTATTVQVPTTDVAPAAPAVEEPSGTTVTQAWWQRDDSPPTGPTLPPLGMIAPPPPPPPKRPKSHLFGLTMATIALAIAGLWILDATTSYDPHPSIYPGTALAIIAAGLLLGAWWGRSRGLIVMGLLASLLTLGGVLLGPGPYGDVVARPTNSSQLESTYKLGAGQFTLHLEQISDIENLAGKVVAVNARYGHVVVIIPSSVAATVDATVRHGAIYGVRQSQDLTQGGQHARLDPESAGRPALTIFVHLKYGEIDIERAACPGAAQPAAGESTQYWNGGNYVPAACN